MFYSIRFSCFLETQDLALNHFFSTDGEQVFYMVDSDQQFCRVVNNTRSAFTYSINIVPRLLVLVEMGMPVVGIYVFIVEKFFGAGTFATLYSSDLTS